MEILIAAMLLVGIACWMVLKKGHRTALLVNEEKDPS